MTTVQSSFCAFSGNSNSNNTNITYNCGVQVPSYIPATFEELINCTGWGVSPPEIDLDHLRDEYNLPRGDTGKWIFEEAVYRMWRESKESKVLWLCGGPGTGKTMLAKRVAAEFLKELDDLPDKVKLVFHFVSPELPTSEISTDEAELPQSRLAKVASDLLYGILQQDGNLFNSCKAELQKQGDRFFTNSCSLWKVLRKTIQECKTDPVYILIDGVDGLRESLCKELIERILELMGIRIVKIFLSCRDVPHISNNLPPSCRECATINLDTNRFVKEDVETFIRRRVNAWGWENDLREKAMEALLAKSEGIFLWASLAIDNLTYFSSGPDFDRILKKPRLGLEDVYRKMLHTVLSRGESGEVLNMIWSVSLALRPLTFSELGHILACIEEKARAKQRSCYGRGTNSEIRPRTEKEIKIYVRSSMGFLRATTETVSIVHHTAIEYLFDEYSKGSLPVLSKSEAELAVSWECFRYLHYAFGDPKRFPRGDTRWGNTLSGGSSFVGDHQGKGPGETFWEVAREDPQQTAVRWRFLRYASECWYIHARRSIEISKNNFCDDSTCNWLQHQFFETSDIIRKPWIGLCGDPRMNVLAGEQTPLHIVVCLGLTPLVEKALSEFTQEMNSYWSPLHLAARFISGAYKILIDKSEPSLLRLPDQDGNTPLHEAVISGHSSMLKALVNKLVDHRVCHDEINKKNHSGNTPLHLAFQFDHTEIVELLVNKGADLTIKNNALLTAPELGVELERGDSLNVLKRDEEKLAEAKKGIVKEPPCLRENPGDLATTLFSNNTNITNNHSKQVRSYVPAAFKELMVDMGWVPPQIDLEHLRNEYNLPGAKSGEWIFEEVGYRTWRESRQSNLLWLCGGPGIWRTMLANRVATEFLKGLDDSPIAVKLVFYFVPPRLPIDIYSVSRGRLSQRRLAKVASDLLYNILRQDENLFMGCKAELIKQKNGFFTNPSLLWMLLTKAIWECRMDPVYILIDGIDGLGKSLCKELIRRILELRKIRKVKIFLSSRDVSYISKNLPHGPHEFTKINLDSNSPAKEDSETLAWLRANAQGWDAKQRGDTMETHLAKSEGFLFPVRLVIEHLKQFDLGSDFDEFLRKPRLGLEEVYQKMLGTLLSRGVSQKVLSTIWFVALALRPLTFGELGYMLACIEGGSRAKPGPSRERIKREIQPRAEKKIRIYVQSSMGFLQATNTTVSIVHYTAREYLFSENGKGNFPVLSKSEADFKISLECFQYLHDVFGDPGQFPRGEARRYHNRSWDSSWEREHPEEELQATPWEEARTAPRKAVAKWPYLRYAAESWFIHACRSIEISKDNFGDHACNWLQYQFFGTNDTIRKPWIELCKDARMEVLAGEQTPLHIAVCLGLIPLVEKALSGFTMVENHNLSPLHLAAAFMSGAHEILIAKGGPSLLTAQDRGGNTPLHAAAIFGHLSMLVGLVEKFATPDYMAYSNEINRKNHLGNTPLHLALKFARSDMVEFLVTSGADLNIMNNAQETASELGKALGRDWSRDVSDCL